MMRAVNGPENQYYGPPKLTGVSEQQPAAMKARMPVYGGISLN